MAHELVTQQNQTATNINLCGNENTTSTPIAIATIGKSTHSTIIVEHSVPAQTITAPSVPKIPAELRNCAQWVCWKNTDRDGKPTKIPVQPNGSPAKSSDPETWSTYQAAFAQSHKYAGLGFVFSVDDDYAGVDLDGCRDPNSGYIEPWASEIIERFEHAYIEVSPSRTGVKMFVRSGVQFDRGLIVDVPAENKYGKTPAIEAYSSGRYFAVTGQVLPNRETLGDCTEAIEWLRTKVDAIKQASRKSTPSVVPAMAFSGGHQGDQRVIDRARAYIAKMPPAIAGQRGHDATFKVAIALVKGFALDEQNAMSLMAEYNRLCQPPWEPRDLIRKVQEAAKAEIKEGYLLGELGDGFGTGTGSFGTPSAKTPEIPGENGVSVSSQDPERKKQLDVPDEIEYRPFPVEALPPVIGQYVSQLAEAVCCDPSFVALPLLTGLASAIGNSLRLSVKRDWSIPSILWCCTVAPSGSGKSIAPEKALRPLIKRQSRLMKQFQRDMEQYETELAIYEKQSAEWKKGKTDGDPPTAPVVPVCQRLIVSDSTIEALGLRLQDNPRGILANFDELAGWIGGFDRYKSGSGDAAKWLEFFSGRTSIIDRAKSNRPLIIDRASVSLFGTVQPTILRKHLTAEHKASGLAARLLFAMPPRQLKVYRESEVEEAVENAVNGVFESLLAIEMQTNEEGDLVPAYVRLDPPAKDLFIRYYNRHNREQLELSEDLYSAYSKLEEAAARLALVIHGVRYALGETASLYQLDVQSMAAGIELCEWFKHEAKRVYGVLSESETENDTRGVLDWIKRQSGPVSPREVHRGNRTAFSSSDAAEVFLKKLVQQGLGTFEPIEPSPAGGRPTVKFSLKS